MVPPTQASAADGAVSEFDGALKEVLLPPNAAGDWETVVQADADDERPPPLPGLKLFFLIGVMRPRRNELSRRSLGEEVDEPSTADRCISSIAGTHEEKVACCVGWWC